MKAKEIIENTPMSLVPSDSKPDNYHYFTDDDAEELAKLNPEIASMLDDEEGKQAMRDALSGKNLVNLSKYNENFDEYFTILKKKYGKD